MKALYNVLACDKIRSIQIKDGIFTAPFLLFAYPLTRFVCLFVCLSLFLFVSFFNAFTTAIITTRGISLLVLCLITISVINIHCIGLVSPVCPYEFECMRIGWNSELLIKTEEKLHVCTCTSTQWIPMAYPIFVQVTVPAQLLVRRIMKTFLTT